MYKKGIVFSPDLKQEIVGRKTMIDKGTYEEAIIADWMEQGLGFRMTTLMVNQHRHEEGLIPVGRSCVIKNQNSIN